MEDLPTYHYLTQTSEPQLIPKQHWLSSKVRLNWAVPVACSKVSASLFMARLEGTTSPGEMGDTPPQQSQTTGRAPDRTPACPKQPATRLKTSFAPYGCLQNTSRSKNKTAKLNTGDASGLYCCCRGTGTRLNHSDIISEL